jgi:DNA repair exonuclease SbcCD ATPase subunit
MSLLGKIFTMLIMIMSLVFMTLAMMTYATHRNWQTAATTLKGQLTNQKATNQALLRDIDTLKATLAREQVARVSVVATLQSKLGQSTAVQQNQEAELQKKNAALTEQTQTAKLAEERSKALSEENTKLRSDLRIAMEDRDNQYLLSQKRLDDLSQAEATKRTLQERFDAMTKQFAKLKEVATKRGFTEDDLVKDITPDVDGQILKVSDNGKLVELSIGRDEGLREGHTLVVYRGSSYVGKVQIRETAPDRAVGQVLEKFSNGPIKVNDNVTASLSTSR